VTGLTSETCSSFATHYSSRREAEIRVRSRGGVPKANDRDLGRGPVDLSLGASVGLSLNQGSTCESAVVVDSDPTVVLLLPTTKPHKHLPQVESDSVGVTERFVGR
jgi:hypothetical protein